MSEHSSIEWTDATWNPVTGCTKVSPGCNHCYAETFAERFRGVPGHHFENGFDVTLRPARLDQPLKWRKPRRVFVNSMSDLFHEAVPDEHIVQVFQVMADTPRHTYQVLTKRHARMRSFMHRLAWRTATTEERHKHGIYGSRAYLQNDDGALNKHLGMPSPLPNVWLGVSAEDQKRADLRIPALLETPAAVRFISAEPLLGPVDLRNLQARNGARIDCLSGDVKGSDGAVYTGTPSVLDWVIVGGESSPGARPMHPGWARSLRDQCTAAGVPFFFKQWGEWGPAPFVVRVCDPAVGWQGTDEELAAAKRDAEAEGATHVHTGQWHVDNGEKVWNIHEIGHKPWSLERAGLPDGMEPIRRWGKKHAGRELDGRTWEEFPARRNRSPVTGRSCPSPDATR